MFFTGCDATLLVSSSTKMNHTLSHSGLLLTSCFSNIVSKIIKLPYGGPGGIRTRVLNPFQSTSYHHNSYLTASVCLPLKLFFNSLSQSTLAFTRLCFNSARLSLITSFLTFITCIYTYSKFLTKANRNSVLIYQSHHSPHYSILQHVEHLRY